MKFIQIFELFSNKPEYDKVLNLFANMSEQSLSCVDTMMHRYEKFSNSIKECKNFEEDYVKTGINLEFLDKPNSHLKLQYSAPRKDYNLTITPPTIESMNELFDNKTENRKSLNLLTLYETFSVWGKEYLYEFDLVSSLEGIFLSLKVSEINCETFLTETINIVNRKISKSDLEILFDQTTNKGTGV